MMRMILATLLLALPASAQWIGQPYGPGDEPFGKTPGICAHGRISVSLFPIPQPAIYLVLVGQDRVDMTVLGERLLVAPMAILLAPVGPHAMATANVPLPPMLPSPIVVHVQGVAFIPGTPNRIMLSRGLSLVIP